MKLRKALGSLFVVAVGGLCLAMAGGQKQTEVKQLEKVVVTTTTPSVQEVRDLWTEFRSMKDVPIDEKNEFLVARRTEVKKALLALYPIGDPMRNRIDPLEAAHEEDWAQSNGADITGWLNYFPFTGDPNNCARRIPLHTNVTCSSGASYCRAFVYVWDSIGQAFHKYAYEKTCDGSDIITRDANGTIHVFYDTTWELNYP